MKTRRFKALTEGNQPEIVEKIAVYDDNGNQLDCSVIHLDKDGREYYYSSNPHNNLGLFGRIQDAIEYVRNDFGDVVAIGRLLGFSMYHVVRYIDREYGESIRQQSLEYWKGTKFAFGVKFSFINSFNDGRPVMKNNMLMIFKDDYKDILKFDTEEEAQKYINDVKKKAEEYYEKYKALKRTGDEDYDWNNIIFPFFNDIENYSEVCWRVFCAIEDEKKNNEKVYKLEVIQVVANDEVEEESYV